MAGPVPKEWRAEWVARTIVHPPQPLPHPFPLVSMDSYSMPPSKSVDSSRTAAPALSPATRRRTLFPASSTRRNSGTWHAM